MNILIACEMSGVVREAFRAKGHNAWSCDLLPSEIPGNHFVCDVFQAIVHGPVWAGSLWDMMIAFPPCTHLCVSGARWFKFKQQEQLKAKLFFKALAHAPATRIAIENPIGIMSTCYRKPDQIIQPWQFGHGETKATCLWLKNLPLLEPTNIVSGREARIHRMAPSATRSIDRSRTFTGIARAMADQWGNL